MSSETVSININKCYRISEELNEAWPKYMLEPEDFNMKNFRININKNYFEVLRKFKSKIEILRAPCVDMCKFDHSQPPWLKSLEGCYDLDITQWLVMHADQIYCPRDPSKN